MIVDAAAFFFAWCSDCSDSVFTGRISLTGFFYTESDSIDPNNEPERKRAKDGEPERTGTLRGAVQRPAGRGGRTSGTWDSGLAGRPVRS